MPYASRAHVWSREGRAGGVGDEANLAATQLVRLREEDVDAGDDGTNVHTVDYAGCLSRIQKRLSQFVLMTRQLRFRTRD